MKLSDNLVIGLDYGTDSGRAMLMDAETGKELALSIKEYPRWKKGMYCDPIKSQFRQHPLDYIEVLEFIVKDVLERVPGAAEKIKAISVDMTGSTPVAVDKNGTPLSLLKGFEENPDAMFILWKDHTGQKENDYINDFSKKWHLDYTKSSGCGDYSTEHFWTKALHIFKIPEIKSVAHSFVESSDWLPAVLCGITKPEEIKRGMGIAGSRVMWNKDWGGYPPNEFFKTLDPVLDGLVDTFNKQAYTCDQEAGTITAEWADRLGLPKNVKIAVGNLDCHAGAIGAGVKDKSMVEIVGTSTCAITVGPKSLGNKLVPGIPQQADDIILPGLVGYEAGQSAFGDLYAWFKKLLMWPLDNIMLNSNISDAETRKELRDEVYAEMIPALAKVAKTIPPKDSHIIATDWINGRRSPNVDYELKGTITGLALSSIAPLVYKSLVEATAYGAKNIIDRFINNGVELNEIIAVGGISQKSPYVMQVMADVIGMPIKVIATREACALGVAMCASVVAGIYKNIEEAQQKMGMEISTIYYPNQEHHEHYKIEFDKYLQLEKIKDIIH
ncbi:ribulokinase [Apibacter muscae]|uniref:Ribulokinase n=1 Tax=Apibacter muscae TaxID=2509004 RepID=A0A563DFN6_9FLAO|nr:ribulokinase [Apibacter muscae]TWP28791.1 ribulokinase [Apibacter muscae]